MLVTVLMENTALQENFVCEHGLSLWLESRGMRILFDFGQTEAYLQNARELGIPVEQADIAILSHGHYDHSGGAEAFLSMQTHTPIHVHPPAFGQFYHGEKYIGISDALKHHPRMIKTENVHPLNECMTLLSCHDQRPVAPAYGGELSMEQEGMRMPDPFMHEQYLVVQEGSKRIVISGCSHKGIVNIVHWLKPDVLLGGFHLSKVTDEAEIRRIGHALLDSGCTFYTGHCTGENAYQTLKSMMGGKLHALHAGRQFEI